MKKRFLSLLVVFVLLLSAVYGCGGSEESGNGYESRPQKVTLAYYYGGYGSAYWDALAKDFMDNYDSDIYLKMVPIYDEQARPRIQAGVPDGDIVFVSMDMFRYSSSLEELSGLYDSYPLGETSKTIKEKVGDMYDYYMEKNGIYQLPATNMWGYNWVYNKTTLDETFGAGNYNLPRTTDEFFAFGNQLKEKGVYLTSGSFGGASGQDDYLVYAFQNWFAQMMGAENYGKFYDGKYFSEGEWKLSEESPLILSENQSAIKSAYSVAYKLCKKENNYLHPSSGSLAFMDSNQVFAGGGFGMNKAKTAFLYTGAWFVNEIKDLLEDEIIDEQEYGVMTTPVASDIVKTLEYRNGGEFMTDETLSLVIKAIDEGKTSYDGVSAIDFARLKEARSMVVEQVCSEIVVPKIKDEAKRESIFKVVKYLTSDNAQKVATKGTNGVPMLPFGYKPDYNDLGVQLSKFMTDFANISAKSTVIDFACVNKTFKHATSVDWYFNTSGILAGAIYSGTASEANYDSTYSHYSGTWSSLISTYKDMVG